MRIGGMRHVETVARNVRAADPRQIGRDNREALGEPRHQRPPHARCFRVAVQQDDRRPAAGGQVLQLHARRRWPCARRP